MDDPQYQQPLSEHSSPDLICPEKPSDFTVNSYPPSETATWKA
jgi:hypothetical protein